MSSSSSSSSSSSASSPDKSKGSNGTVVMNPVGPKGGFTNDIQRKAEQAVGDTMDAFLSKPFQTTSVTLSFLSTILSIISTFTPWFRTVSGPTELAEGTFSMVVTVYTTEFRYCNEVSGVKRTNNTDPNFINAAECTVVTLPDIAPVFSFFYSAGTVALTFVILSLFFSVPAAYITYLRRIGSLWRIPERFYVFRKGKVTPILHLFSAIFLNVAWGNYVGNVLSNYKASNLQRVIFYELPFNDPILTGGFGCAVAAWLCSIIAAILTFVFQEEISRTLPPTATDVKSKDNTTASLASENTKIGASIAGAYTDPPVSEWNGSSASSTVNSTPAYSTISIASYASSVPPTLPAATRIGSTTTTPQFSSGGSTGNDNAPPLPPKTGRGAAVLLAQGIHSTTAVSESTRNFALPPPLPDEDERDNATI